MWQYQDRKNSDVVIGIDFGTSNSCVAVWRPDKKRVKIIKNTIKPIGKRTTPSTITFHDSFVKYSIGDDSLNDSEDVVNLTNKAEAIKRCLGATSAVCDDEVVGSHVMYNKEDDKVLYRCYDANKSEKYFPPEELASYIIKYLKTLAEEYLERRPFKSSESDSVARTNKTGNKKVKISSVVIGIPANYNDKQKDAIRAAAEMSGFDTVHLLIESTAAAMSYGLLVAGTKNVLIVDIGGGTLDLTVLNINDGVHKVEATGGHLSLGGCMMDVKLLECVEAKILKLLLEKKYSHMNKDVMMEKLNKMRPQLLLLCKNCKEELTDAEETVIELPSLQAIYDDTIQKNHVDKQKLIITRTEFESSIKVITDLVTASIVHTVQQWVDRNNADNKKQPIDVQNCLDEVVLVGGTSRVPVVRSAIRQACCQLHIIKFEKDNHELCTSMNPDEIVAEGLALRGAILSGADTGMLKNVLMMDCLAMSIGLMTWSLGTDSNSNNNNIHGSVSTGSRLFEAILGKGDKIPAKGMKRFRVDSNQKFVSLDIYEEIDQQKHLHDSSDTIVTEYAHNLVHTTDVPMPSNCIADSDGQTLIEVVFEVDEHSRLSYDVISVSDTISTSIAEKKGSDAASNKAMFYLILYIMLMFVLYISVKMFLVEVEENNTINGSMANNIVSSDSVFTEL